MKSQTLFHNVSPATLRALELPELLSLVAALASTDLGVERLGSLRLFETEEELLQHHRRYEEVRRLLAARTLVPSRERGIGPILRAVQGGHERLTGLDMVEIAALLQTTSEAVERVKAAEPICPSLGLLVDDLPDLQELAQRLRKTFDGRGEIRENATPRLAELRVRIRQSRQSMYDQLGRMVELHRDHLSDDTVSVRGGRLVLTLQSGAKGRMAGLTHGKSGSGRSFYFEPLEAVEGNNQLQQAMEDEEAEKARIFREVLELLRGHKEDLEQHAEFLAELDVLQASVRLAERFGGRLAEVAPRHDLRLVAARHPLLDPSLADLRRQVLGQPGHMEPVVPLDLELSEDRRTLLITGPNAGGKTVTLKTLGLLALAHQCGLPIPVDKGSRIPFFRAVVATIGDDQDLLADQSTFSGRLLRLKEAWEHASPDALILLDELGSGTDPEEGAALSRALMEGLLERRPLTLITTHLSQLAVAALDLDGAFCAAMQFDDGSGEPTYRLLPGPPGASEAVSLAHRLGLPAPWLERAEALLGSEHKELRRLLAEVENQRRELAELHSRLDAEVRDAEVLRERLVQREQELVDEKRAVGKRLKAELEVFRQETRDRLRDEVDKLRRQLESDGGGVGRRKRLAADVEETLFRRAPEVEVEPNEELPLEVGKPVRHKKLGWQGELEKLERGKAQVSVNGKSLLCKARDLTGMRPDPTTLPRKSSSRAPRRTRSMRETSSDAPPKELHLIGRRVEPALEELDRYLDRALLASMGQVRVVHGHGTGRLRDAVREHLSGHLAVSSLRPGGKGEGGDGATVVDLAG
ncbi:MAG: Smr/MutS family protein [Thermoanaerobaculia bacterium]|nr:Smr/MutS family protein [Thermoanaerobaculia bacterium]